MAEHYTKNTVAVSKYCKPCGKFTMHSVLGGQIVSCQQCLDKPIEKKPEKEPRAVSGDLF